jgi:hypothetical protein
MGDLLEIVLILGRVGFENVTRVFPATHSAIHWNAFEKYLGIEEGRDTAVMFRGRQSGSLKAVIINFESRKPK